MVMSTNSPWRAGTARPKSPISRLSVKKSIRISGLRRLEIVSGDCSCLSKAFLCCTVIGAAMSEAYESVVVAEGILKDYAVIAVEGGES